MRSEKKQKTITTTTTTIKKQKRFDQVLEDLHHVFFMTSTTLFQSSMKSISRNIFVNLTMIDEDRH